MDLRFLQSTPMPRNSLAIAGRLSLVVAASMGLASCVRFRASTGGDPAAAVGVVRQEAGSRAVGDTVIGTSYTSASDHEAVMRTVKRLFDGMRAGDSAMVRSAFDSNPRLVTTMVRNGVPVISTGSVEDFVRAVGTPHDEVWDERISGEIVQVDGPLATVWMRYSFYAGSRFSHCGVNAFELFQRPDGWRITSIADTRRRDRCDASGE